MSTLLASKRWITAGSAILMAAALLSAPAAFSKGPSTKPPHGGGSGGGTCTTIYPVVDTYNARAVSLEVHAKLLKLIGSPVQVDLVQSDTLELGPTSSETQRDAHLANLKLALPSKKSPLVTVDAGILDAMAKSMANTSTGWSNVVGLNLGVGGMLSVTADLIQATAAGVRDPNAKCDGGSYSANATDYSGSNSYLANLQIVAGGVPLSIPADPHENTTIEVPGLVKVVLNEQTTRADGRQVVNAVHVTLGGALAGLLSAEVIISHADASITGACGAPTTICEPVSCKPKDFVTGGGWVTLDDKGTKGTFGFNGGIKPSGFQGHLTYQDHRTAPPTTTTGTGVSDYRAPDPNGGLREVDYLCAAGTCTLSATDNGEPGGGVDTFGLGSSDGTVVVPYQLISKGNIQLHKSSCPSAP